MGGIMRRKRKRNNHIGYPKPQHTNRAYIWIRNNSIDQEMNFDNSSMLMLVIAKDVTGEYYDW